MKRVLSLVLALSMVLGMCTFAFATDLSDVDGQYYQASVEALVELGVVNGYPDGTYRANEVVTRAELAKMLVICLGQEEAAKIAAGSTQFTDVPAGHWAEGYINVATQYKVIVGYPDGTFLPEEPVTYAEAVTMVLRALGYKNVVESAGTWPTNYITKANELQLLKDARDLETDAGAKRGNVAVVLWNMLRTKMWDIQSENQTNGMTYGETDYMLNVKFPDYEYLDEAYVTGVSVDNGEVTVSLEYEGKDQTGRNTTLPISGKVENVDLPRILKGMRVTSLVKNYNDDDSEVLTLTPYYNLVEGVVEKVTDTRVTVDGTEYRVNGLNVNKNDYVVLEVSGKNVNTYEVKVDEDTTTTPVATVLPTGVKVVNKLSAMERDIDEDALVIIDGEWATRDDIEEGDVYTTLEDVNASGTYYMVARERETGTFDSLTSETDKNRTAYLYLEIDGEEYRALASNFKAYDSEDNDHEIFQDDLQENPKTNKYLDQEVELVFNYLGQVVRLYFGEVSDLEDNGAFYVITSDGAWVEPGSRRTYHILLTGLDGEEDEYVFSTSAEGKKFDVDNEEGEYTENGSFSHEVDTYEAKFVYVEFNNAGEITSMTVLADEVATLGDSEYKSATFTTPGLDDDNYLDQADKGGKVTSTTVVVSATPVTEGTEENEKITGLDVTISEGADALNGVEEGIFVYKGDSKLAKYVFINEAASSNLLFGVVERYSNKSALPKVTFLHDTTIYEIKDDDELNENVAPVGSLVAYTLSDDKVVPQHIYTPGELTKEYTEEADTSYIHVLDVNGEFITVKGWDENGEKLEEKEYDLTLATTFADAKSLNFVLVEAGADKDGKVTFDGAELIGKGPKSLVGNVQDNDLICILEDWVLVIRIEELGKTDAVVDGVLNQYTTLDAEDLAEETKVVGKASHATTYTVTQEGSTLKFKTEKDQKITGNYGVPTAKENKYAVLFTLTAPKGIYIDGTAEIQIGNTDPQGSAAFDTPNSIDLWAAFTDPTDKIILRVKWNAETPEYTFTIDLTDVEVGEA